MAAPPNPVMLLRPLGVFAVIHEDQMYIERYMDPDRSARVLSKRGFGNCDASVSRGMTGSGRVASRRAWRRGRHANRQHYRMRNGPSIETGRTPFRHGN